MALNIGPITVDPPVVLAPMAGVTNAVYRKLCRSYGAGLYVSEMISARALVEHDPKTAGMLTFGDDETIRSVQLYGVDPDAVGGAARVLIADFGVDHIDLNFGCPVGKVTRRGGGAALPLHHALFRAIVRATVTASGDVPVTVKLRIGTDAHHETAIASGLAAEAEGAAAVALHARTAEQLYSGTADWRAIAALKAAVRSVPVLGNGDIWEAADALRMMAETGCDGVVIGRGCLGRPWLFRDLADAFAGRPVRPAPALGLVADTMAVHAELLCTLSGHDTGVREFRKHVAWYLAGYPVGAAARRRLTLAPDLRELLTAIDALDRDLELPHGTALHRGPTNGPRPVHLPEGWPPASGALVALAGADLVVSGG